MDDTEDLLSAVGIATDKIKANSQEAQSIIKEQRAAQVDVLTSMRTSEEERAKLQELKSKEVQKAENATAEFATRIGSNPTDAANVMNLLADKVKETTVNALQAREKLQQDLNISVWKNPLDWAWAQINMESTIKKAEGATQQRNDLVQSANQIQALTQQAAATNATLIKTKTDAMMQAEAAATKADANINYNIQVIKNAGVNLDGLAHLNNMTSQELSMAGMPRNIRMQEDAEKRAKEAHAWASKEHALRLEALKNAKDEKAQDKLNLQEMQDFYIAGAKSLGIERVRMPDRTFASFIKSDEEAQNFWKRGMQIAATGTGTAMVADTAGKSAMLISDFNAPLRAEQQQIKSFLQDALTKAANAKGGIKDAKGNLVMIDPTKRDSVANGTTVVANKMATSMHSDITNDPNNIYSAPPLPSVFEIPGVKDTAYGRKILAPQMEAGGLKEFNHKQLTALATQGIKSGKITYDEAVAGLGSVFGAAAKINNVTKQYSNFGLPNQTAFNVTVPNSFGFNKNINLMDAKQLSNHLSSELSNLNTAERIRKDTEAGRYPGGFNN